MASRCRTEHALDDQPFIVKPTSLRGSLPRYDPNDFDRSLRNTSRRAPRGALNSIATGAPPSFFPSAFLPVLPGAMWVYSLASAQAFMTQAILNSFVLAFSLNRAYRSGLGIHCAGARGCVLTRCRFDRCRSMMFWKSGRSKEQRWFYSVMLVS